MHAFLQYPNRERANLGAENRISYMDYVCAQFFYMYRLLRRWTIAYDYYRAAVGALIKDGTQMNDIDEIV